MFITPSFKKSLIVEQFQGNYLKGNIIWTCSGGPVTSLSVAFISFAKREAIDFCQIFFSIIAGIVLIEFIKQKVGVTVLV